MPQASAAKTKRDRNDLARKGKMAERRSLVAGISTAPQAPTAREEEFVYGQTQPKAESKPTPSTTPNVASSPLSTRIRTDFAAALKRASLDRQLNGQEPNTIREILEQAIEPWLKTNGYIP
jgi:hypothetical protein